LEYRKPDGAIISVKSLLSFWRNRWLLLKKTKWSLDVIDQLLQNLSKDKDVLEVVIAECVHLDKGRGT
jgi:hypothetical protein